MQTYGQEGALNTDTELSHVLHDSKHQAAFYVEENKPQDLLRSFISETGLSEEEAVEVLKAVKGGGGGGSGDFSASLTALELLQKEEELRSIVTFSSQLDESLGGGIPVGKITEVCGVPGIGKTQLW